MTAQASNQLINHSRQIIVIMVAIFLLALGVRLIVWQFNRTAIEQVMTGLTIGYKNDARVLARGELRLFLQGPEPPSNANVLAHPPGYSMLIALFFRLFGESDAALRWFQIFCDALSVVLVFLIALQLISKRVAIIAGGIVSLSPQLAYNALLLLPDSLSVLPILAGVYLVIRAWQMRRRWLWYATAGAMFGLSCWLRPNALLLPFLVAALVMIVSKRAQGLRAALPLVAAALLVIAPLTIRNLVIFKSVIPISLGSGVTLTEGIADYDSNGTLGFKRTDMELLQQEAESFEKPAYAGSLFNPDGIPRERARVARGVAAIRSHPLWFAGVMARRAASMLKWERVPVISGSPLQLGSDPTTTTQPTTTATPIRLPGIILKSLQKLFITAIMLPLAMIGLFLLIRTKDARALAFLLAVPAYYICIQSLLHTEYRYVLAIQYFLIILVALSVNHLTNVAWQALHNRKTNTER